MIDNEPVLEIRNLTTEFEIGGAWYPAVRNLSLTLRGRETLAVVGESGSGKSITALSVINLLPKYGARIAGGQVLFEGIDLSQQSESSLADIRGNSIAMIFQEPMTSLNPTMRVGEQIAETIRIHRKVSRREARAEALRLLQEVRIPSAERRLDEYPHQFSGGMRQRVMIAMALACRPKILLADEPTTALDVTIQAQVLSLIDELKAMHDMSILFITHNLGVVALIADRVAVLYAGEVVELTDVNAIFENPQHPYTEALLRAMPRVDRTNTVTESIPGQVPSLTTMPTGCGFAARCPLKIARCEGEHPELAPLAHNGEHQVRCFVRAPVEARP